MIFRVCVNVNDDVNDFWHNYNKVGETNNILFTLTTFIVYPTIKLIETNILMFPLTMLQNRLSVSKNNCLP